MKYGIANWCAPFCLMLLMLVNCNVVLADNWTENFNTGMPGGYTAGPNTVITLSGRNWTSNAVIGEAAGASRGGTGSAARINDDRAGAHLTTPALNTIGTVSFYYRELNSGGGTFQVQTSTDGTTFSTVASQAYSGTTYNLFSLAIDNAAPTIYIRILSDNNPGHLVIDDFSVTDYVAATPEINFAVTSASVSETGTTYSIQVTSNLTGSHTADIVILTGGTASNGSEYSFTPPITATFAGSTTFSTNVTINDNGTCDGSTDVLFGLNNVTGTGASIGGDDSLWLTIVDDETSTYTFSSLQFEGCNTSTHTTNGVDHAGTQVEVNGIQLSGGENIQVASVDVSAFSSVTFSIDYSSSGMDSGEDAVLRLYYDGSATPDFTHNLIDNGIDVGVRTTYTTNIPNGTSSVVAEVVNFANGASDYIYLDNIIMSGDYCACTPPATSAVISNESSNENSISFDLNAPTGVERLVVVRQGSAVTCDPTNTVSYTGNTIYGSGTELGTNNFVVHSGTATTLTVTNLAPETDYHISVFDYDPSNNCYNLTESTTTITTTCPSPLNDVTGQSTSNCENEATTVSWTLPSNCYDEILVVANEISGIDFSPSGDGTAYTANSVYAAANQVVYQGAGTSVTVTGLTNDNTYYYEIFVRKGTSWSNGVEVSCTPVLSYCDPAPTSVDNSGITNITMGTINNTTGAEPGNYADYTAMSTTVVQGATVSLDITYSTGFTYNTKVWVDWNNDGDFLDGGEEVVDTVSLATNPTTLSVTFDVPVAASTGARRIRIGGADIATPTPCYTGSFASFEDYTLNVILACTPTHTFTSFGPIEGPDETLVTIVGTGFTMSTIVTIDGNLASTSFVNSDTIIAEVPIGATTGEISVSESSCPISSASDFTVTQGSTPCTAPANFTGLIISEVYDSDGGNTWYMEIYNPTASPIDLDAAGTDYTIENYSDAADLTANNTIDLTGVIPAGGVFILDLGGDETDCPSLTFDFAVDLAGINEDDVVHLLLNGTVVDEVIAPNQIGYSILRNGDATGPEATYDAADWTLLTTESCADLGIPPVATIAAPSITPDPVDITGTIATFNIGATDGNGGTLTYQWKYNDGTSAGWFDVTDAAFSPLTVDGEQTDSLSIHGTGIEDIENYQFYCEVIEDGSCQIVSHAAQFYVNMPMPVGEIKLRGKSTLEGNILSWNVDQFSANPTYQLLRSDKPSGFKEISRQQTATGSTEQSYLDFNSSGKQFYKVISEHPITGKITQSNVVVLESINKTKLKVFPNPSNGHVNISVEGGSIMKILIYDEAGRLLLDSTETNIDLNLASGIYMVGVIDEISRNFQKLVVY